jgi:hypothetical protein
LFFSGEVSQPVDANILDGQPDDSPITDRNQQSITSYTYLSGTEKPVSVIRDGAVTNLTYDYRQRVIATKVYPYEGKMLESKNRKTVPPRKTLPPTLAHVPK